MQSVTTLTSSRLCSWNLIIPYLSSHHRHLLMECMLVKASVSLTFNSNINELSSACRHCSACADRHKLCNTTQKTYTGIVMAYNAILFPLHLVRHSIHSGNYQKFSINFLAQTCFHSMVALITSACDVLMKASWMQMLHTIQLTAVTSQQKFYAYILCLQNDHAF